MGKAVAMIGGVYHPRSKGGAMSDALADARAGAGAAAAHADDARRGPAAVRGRAGGAGGAGQLSRRRRQPQQCQWPRPSPICWARWARPPPIFCCRHSASPRSRFLAPPAFWGLRALSGKNLRHAMWRLVAWPLGTLTVAAGLGSSRRPPACRPALGGWIGIAAHALSTHAAQTLWRRRLVWAAVPLFLLAVGLPLAFLATGLRFMPHGCAALCEYARRRSGGSAACIKISQLPQGAPIAA